MAFKRTVGFAVKALNNQIRRTTETQEPKGNAVTGMQRGVIDFVYDRQEYGAVFQGDIEREFNIRRSTATGILQLMEKNGLLTRESVSYDARRKRIVLTPKACQIHRALANDIDELEKKLTRGLSSDDVSKFLETVDEMLINLG